jgi:hypothetical protein
MPQAISRKIADAKIRRGLGRGSNTQLRLTKVNLGCRRLS